MRVAYTIGGGGLHMKKFRVDDGITIARGVPVESDEAAGDTQGVTACTTTTGDSLVGLSLDTATSTAAQNADGITDNAGFVTVCINPDAVFEAKLNNGATEDTALAIITQASASTAGTTVGGGSPTVTDEATVWGFTGANAGQERFATAASTVVLAFPFDIAAGDEFLEAILNRGSLTQAPTLTTLLTQVDATAAVAANVNFIVVDFQLNDSTNDGRNNSFVELIGHDHIFAGSQLA